jgi:hypothetical protein
MDTVQNTGEVVEISERKTNQAALAFIFAVILMDLIGLTILIPVTPYIVSQYSRQALMVTLMTVLYAAAQFIAAPLLGRLSDRYGRRPVLLISILGSAVGYFLFGIGGAFWVLFLSRLIDGFTGGNISTASAYIADVTPPHERAIFRISRRDFRWGSSWARVGKFSQSITAPALRRRAFVAVERDRRVLSCRIGRGNVRKAALAGCQPSQNPPAPAPPELTVLSRQAIFNFVAAGFNSLACCFSCRPSESARSRSPASWLWPGSAMSSCRPA